MATDNSTLKQQISEMQKRLAEQELALNELQQYSMRNCVIISGIKEDANESPLGIVIEIGRLIGVNICATDVCNAHRIGKARTDGKPRPIIVKFVRFFKRAEFYSERKSIRDAVVDGESCFRADTLRTVYVADCLTRHNSEVMYLARKLKREGAIARAWTDFGIMKVRADNDGPTIKIRGIQDLQKLVGDHPALDQSSTDTSGKSTQPQAPTESTSDGTRAGPSRPARGGRSTSRGGTPAGATRGHAGTAAASSSQASPRGGATPRGGASPRFPPTGSGAGASEGRGGRRKNRGR